MSKLTELWSQLSHKYSQGDDETLAELAFIEYLTFSSFEEIDSLIAEVYTENFMNMPVWIRNLSYRLACLLEPNNAQIRRHAAADLRYFGPDWDQEADRLDREADALEKH